MAVAEQLTFGGGGLERAAEVRSDPQKISLCMADEAARGITGWRGKLLFQGDSLNELAALPLDDPIFMYADEAPVFLGQTPDGPRFAFDISAWEPADIPDSHGAFFDTSQVQHPDAADGTRFVDIKTNMSALSALDAELGATAKAILGWHESHGFCAKCGAKSAVFMAGWQRDCPQCHTKHFPRTDPVVIMLVIRNDRVLLGRSPGWPDGMYSLLAGFVEPGETIEAAVMREVAEEVSIPVQNVGYLASQPWPFPSSLMIGCTCEAMADEIIVDPVEIDDARWFDRDSVALAFEGQLEGVFMARSGSIAHFLLRNWVAGNGN